MIGTAHRNLSATAAGETEPPDSSPSDPKIPLLNLSLLGQKMDSLRRFLSDSVDRRVSISGDHLQLLSGEISSALHQVIINASALLPASKLDSKPSNDGQIVEIDAAELMAERAHFCEICGKRFRRDANLRMHMRAHGDRFKTLESLTNPNAPIASTAIRRFSCPFLSCRRNRNHPRFRPLKTVVCVRNHFRRSHCPKMYACDVCGRKSFSVAADLRNHRKSCGGEVQWRCTCGTSFSRKDKLFGHVALFDGHFPVVGDGEEEKGKEVIKGGERAGGSLDDGFFDGLMEEIKGMGGGWIEF